MAALIDDIIDVAKLKSNKLSSLRNKTNIFDLLNEVVSDFMPKCSRKSQSLIIDYDEALPKVLCSSKEITQVLVNLLSNARKYTPENGEIMVRAKAKDNFVEIHVIDTGRGIDAADQEQIFNKFVMVDQTYGNTTKSSGLGLMISKELMQLNGGDILVQSEVGKGSDFMITIPIFSENTEFEAQIEDRIRVAIDNGKPISLLLVRMILHQQGEDAAEKLAKLAPDICNTIKSNIKTSTDHALRSDREDMLAILLESGLEGGKAAAKRIYEVLVDRYGSLMAIDYDISFFDQSTKNQTEIKAWLRGVREQLYHDELEKEVNNEP